MSDPKYSSGITELRPCPFCGGEPSYYASKESVFRAEWTGHIYHCTICQGRVQNTDRMTAQAMWNNRTGGVAQAAPEPFTPADAWDNLVHKDDRTSPEEYPDHCLISFEELQDFMSRSRDVSPGNVVRSSQEPVAWIAFAANGNVRFWTSDPHRTRREKERGLDLRAFTMAELIALVSRLPAPQPLDPAYDAPDPFMEDYKRDTIAGLIEQCATIADDHTPAKHDGTLAAHVTGSTIARAIRALALPSTEGK